jgi:hypothetical protein
VKRRIVASCADHGVVREPFVSARVTQSYDTGEFARVETHDVKTNMLLPGACVYFYFGFLFEGLSNPSHTFNAVESEARCFFYLNHLSSSLHTEMKLFPVEAV